MCQRRQNSLTLRAVNGLWKFSLSSMPNSRALPIAMFEYPAKSP